VDEEDVLDGAGEGLHPGEEFLLVGVAAEFVDLLHFGADADGFAKDVDFLLTIEKFAAEGVFGLETGDQDGVAGIADVIAEMVEDAAGFGHAGGGDDEAGDADIVEGFGLFDIADVAEAAEAEGIVAGVEEGVGFDVVALGVGAEGFGDVDGERAVDKNGDFVDFAFLDELVDHQDDLLGAADGEGGCNDFAAAAGGVVDDGGEFLFGVEDRLMEAVAVRTFHNEDVGEAGEFRIADDGEAFAADVTGEEERFSFEFDFEEGGPEHVAGFVGG